MAIGYFEYFILPASLSLFTILLLRYRSRRKPKTLPLCVGVVKTVSGRGYWQSNPFHLGARFRQQPFSRTARSFASSRRYTTVRTW